MRLAGGGILLRDKKILLLKRSSNQRAFPGYWTLPSGKQEGNELAQEVAIREVKEEIGLDFKISRLYHESIVEYKGYSVHAHRFLGTFSGNFKVQEEEADGYAWFTYDETIKLNLAFDYGNLISKLHDDNYL